MVDLEYKLNTSMLPIKPCKLVNGRYNMFIYNINKIKKYEVDDDRRNNIQKRF